MTKASANTHARVLKTLFTALACCALLPMTACSGGGASGEATGTAFTPATTIEQSTFDVSAAQGENGALVDTSHVADGYVGASAASSARCKLQIVSGQASCNFDLPQDGTAIICPLSFGNGAYTFRVMQNTSGNNYVELYSTSADVALASEFAPFVRPNVYCNYTTSSACVTKARELVKDASNQAEALEDVCAWIVDNVTYDDAKAAQLKDATGYVPNPDETLASGTGVCFDYASLGAAMLRSQGIPARIVTGNVSPNNIYHAWIMVYIDGTWKSAQFSVKANTWSRVDLTFAASGDNANVGDGKDYTDRYVY